MLFRSFRRGSSPVASQLNQPAANDFATIATVRFTQPHGEPPILVRMPGPVEPRLLKRAGATRNYLIASVLVGILISGLVIAQAWLLARVVAIVLTYPSG